MRLLVPGVVVLLLHHVLLMLVHLLSLLMVLGCRRSSRSMMVVLQLAVRLAAAVLLSRLLLRRMLWLWLHVLLSSRALSPVFICRLLLLLSPSLLRGRWLPAASRRRRRIRGGVSLLMTA